MCRFLHQQQGRILLETVLATLPSKQEMSTHHHSTCKVSQKIFSSRVSPCPLCLVERFSLAKTIISWNFPLKLVQLGHWFQDCIVSRCTKGAVGYWSPSGAWLLNRESRLNKVIAVIWHVSYAVLIVFWSPVAGYPSPLILPLSLLDGPWQKVSTRPLILGALPARWFSLVILLFWATPPIWASTDLSLPSTLKIDWWAPTSHWRLVKISKHFFFLLMDHKTFCLVILLNSWVFSSKKRQPLPLSPQNYPLHGSEVNGAHPAGFHSGSSSFGVPNHTPPIAGTETIMGKSYNVFHFYNFPFYVLSDIKIILPHS